MEQQPPPSGPKLDAMTPRQIVAELDRYVIGQKDAKRMVAIALRSRWRRQQLSPELREEIVPKNIIMIGPTGVGKTEVSRRVSKLADAPFIKVEASKFTEVGYVGRDVESVIRDLTDISINQVKTVYLETVQHKAEEMAVERVLDILLPPSPSVSTNEPSENGGRPRAHHRKNLAHKTPHETNSASNYSMESSMIEWWRLKSKNEEGFQLASFPIWAAWKIWKITSEKCSGG